MVTREVVVLQEKLETSSSSHTLQHEEEERKLHLLQNQLHRCESELLQVAEDKEHLEKVCQDQRREKDQLSLAVSHLELVKQDLTFKIANNEKTIQSLKSRVRGWVGTGRCGHGLFPS